MNDDGIVHTSIYFQNDSDSVIFLLACGCLHDKWNVMLSHEESVVVHLQLT